MTTPTLPDRQAFWPSFPPDPGTYILWLHAKNPVTCQVGRLGSFSFPTGWYAYVGSAFGPGGLAARLNRHVRTVKAKHWHIDYLREFWNVGKIWTCLGLPLEHEWAQYLADQTESHIPAPGLGSSDCKCPTHLYGFSNPISFERFQKHFKKTCQGKIFEFNPKQNHG